MNAINQNISGIESLCKSHNVEKLYAFGSIVTENFNEESDVDLIVRFGNVNLLEYADNYFDLKFSLETLFKREVDLIEEKAIKNPYFKTQVEAKRKLIYG